MHRGPVLENGPTDIETFLVVAVGMKCLGCGCECEPSVWNWRKNWNGEY